MSVYQSIDQSNTQDNKLNNFMNKAAPVTYTLGNGVMGSYDGIVFKTDCPGSPWRKTPCTEEQLKGPLFVPQGTPLPLKNEVTYMELPKDSMFVFSRNISDPSCCPATFSTDRGCVCTTAQQRKLIGQTRGNNKNYANYGF